MDNRTPEEHDPGSEDARPREWIIGKMLLDAQMRTGKAFEQYLMMQTVKGQDGANKEYTAAIEQAIAEHTRIIEDLKMAREAANSDEQTATNIEE